MIVKHSNSYRLTSGKRICDTSSQAEKKKKTFKNCILDKQPVTSQQKKINPYSSFSI